MSAPRTSRLSLRARLTAWYSCALILVLAAGAADVSWVLGRLGVRRLDAELDGIVGTLANVMRGELDEHTPEGEAASEACDAVARADRAVAVLDDAGNPIEAHWAGLAPSRLPRSTAPESTIVHETAAGWRIAIERHAFSGGLRYVLVAAGPLGEVEREQRLVREAMLYGGPIVLLAAIGGGWWLATIGLRPVTEMANRAARLRPTGDEDLGDPGRDDEIGRLATAFNGLVARLRATLQTQRQFMADASHEMRTPVSIIRTAADVSLSQPHRDEPQYRESLAIISSEARRLGRLVADMLTLARADAGGYPLHRVDLYLDDVINDCRRAVALLAEPRGVVVRADVPELPFRGDEQLLRELVLNVLQNAVQHSPANGVVLVSARADGPSIRIDVSDSGPGIAAAERERVFDRFVQLDASRRGEGTGLGLPIARWIAEAHGGRLEISSSSSAGTTFSMHLPVDAAVKLPSRNAASVH